MYLSDYHTHTRCSPDSTTPLTAMADAAVAAGLDELCITDHCDLQQEDGSPLKNWNWQPILEQFEDAMFFQSREDFSLRLGIELGGAHTDPERAQALLDGVPLDFVRWLALSQSRVEFPAACRPGLSRWPAGLVRRTEEVPSVENNAKLRCGAPVFRKKGCGRCR